MRERLVRVSCREVSSGDGQRANASVKVPHSENPANRKWLRGDSDADISDANQERKLRDYVGAIDQGTTSTRFMVFDRSARVVAVAQKEHEQIFPRAGWVEHDALEIQRRTEEVIEEALAQRGLRASDLAAIGITNQR